MTWLKMLRKTSEKTGTYSIKFVEFAEIGSLKMQKKEGSEVARLSKIWGWPLREKKLLILPKWKIWWWLVSFLFKSTPTSSLSNCTRTFFFKISGRNTGKKNTHIHAAIMLLHKSKRELFSLKYSNAFWIPTPTNNTCMPTSIVPSAALSGGWANKLTSYYQISPQNYIKPSIMWVWICQVFNVLVFSY